MSKLQPPGLKTWAIVSDRFAVWTAGLRSTSLAKQALVTTSAAASSLKEIFSDHAPLFARSENLRLLDYRCRVFIKPVPMAARTGRNSFRNNRVASLANFIKVWFFCDLGCLGRPFCKRHNQYYAESPVEEQGITRRPKPFQRKLSVISSQWQWQCQYRSDPPELLTSGF